MYSDRKRTTYHVFLNYKTEHTFAAVNNVVAYKHVYFTARYILSLKYLNMVLIRFRHIWRESSVLVHSEIIRPPLCLCLARWKHIIWTDFRFYRKSISKVRMILYKLNYYKSLCSNLCDKNNIIDRLFVYFPTCVNIMWPLSIWCVLYDRLERYIVYTAPSLSSNGHGIW